MRILAMIPARLGSQRLKQKNLAEISGAPLVAHAIRKCREAACFDEIWLNSEDEIFREIAEAEEAGFHRRPAHLGNNLATSEEFVAEFLDLHECDYVVQVHSIAPLLRTREIQDFVGALRQEQPDVLLSVVNESLECVYEGEPVTFTFDATTNSQDLKPVKRIVWAITAWRRTRFLDAALNGRCATYDGDISYFNVSRLAGHVIKVQEDLDMARALFNLVHDT